MALHHETQRTVAKTATLSFTWNVEGFEALRKLAKLKALPCKDRLFSPEFGSKEAGLWKVALFPYGDREAQKHVSLYLFGDQKAKRVAEFSMVVLDEDFKELSETFLGEEPTLFTAESNSWGWHEYLSVDNDDEMKPFLVDNDTFRVKIRVKVYVGVSEEESPRLLFNIVQHRCDHSDDSEDEENYDLNGDGVVVEPVSFAVATSDTGQRNEPLLPVTVGNSPGTNIASRGRNVRAESCSGRETGGAGANVWADGVALANSSAGEAVMMRHASCDGKRTATMYGASGSRASIHNSIAQQTDHNGVLHEVYPVIGRRSGFNRCRRRNTLPVYREATTGKPMKLSTSRQTGAQKDHKEECSAASSNVAESSHAGRVEWQRSLRHRSSYYCCCSASFSGGQSLRRPFASCTNSSKDDVSSRKVQLNIRGRSLQSDIAAFSLNSKILDTVILCGGVKFRANRFILGARSDVFNAMLFGDFVESKMDEIALRDVPVDCVEEFLTFLATDECPSLSLPMKCRCGCGYGGTETIPNNTADSETDSNSKRTCNRGKCNGCVVGRDAVHVAPKLLKLMAAADKYQVTELYSRCVQGLARCICARSVLEILEGAEALRCEPLADACHYYLKNNTAKIEKIVNEVRRRQRSISAATASPEPGLPVVGRRVQYDTRVGGLSKMLSLPEGRRSDSENFSGSNCINRSSIIGGDAVGMLFGHDESIMEEIGGQLYTSSNSDMPSLTSLFRAEDD
eukprot:Lankesteria_metandrocarpae@DN4781_c0_g1_i1.p2